MTGCLYECLQEARLERYHALFVRHGITKCEGLAALSMQDYSQFGITRMEDRVRLFKLVQIVKSVQAEGRFCKHEAAREANSRPLPHFAMAAAAAEPQPEHPTKTRGQAFVKYLKSKSFSRTSDPAFAASAAAAVAGPSWMVPEQNPLPVIKPESVMAPMKKRKPSELQQHAEPAEVKFRPGTGSPIFKCRKVLTFSDCESSDEEDLSGTVETRSETPETASITDSEIRQKVLSTIPTNPISEQPGRRPDTSHPSSHHPLLQNFPQRPEPIRVTVPPPKSFFIDLNTAPPNKPNQNTHQALPVQGEHQPPQQNLFGFSASRVREPTITSNMAAAQKMNAILESPPPVSTQKRINSHSKNEDGNISGEHLARKCAALAKRQESTEQRRAVSKGDDSDSDTETDQYFELPRPSSVSPEKDHAGAQAAAAAAAAAAADPAPIGSKKQVTQPQVVSSSETLKAIAVGPQTQSIDFTSQTVVSASSVPATIVQYNPAKYSPVKKDPFPPLSFHSENTNYKPSTSNEQPQQPSIRQGTAVAIPVTMAPRAIDSKSLPKSSQLREARQKALRPEEPEQHAYFPAAKSSPSPVRKPVVERVLHSADYNYGVPTNTNKPSESPSKRRTPVSSKNTNQRIRVCVRKRPLTRREQKRQEVDIVSVDGSDTVVVDETKVAVDLAKYIQQHIYMFDEVFDESQTNKDVYASTAKPLVRHIFNKGCATCFAFGQTGAGKTYTLLGTPAVPGLYRLAAADMFSLLHSGHFGSDLHLWVSYYEIYCGQLYDLLNKKKKLYVRENGRQRVCIAGLMETRVRNVEDVAQVVQYGNSVRSTGSTGVNPNSSRSHALLQLEIRDSRDQRLGRMSFIDLAGSERASDVTEFDRQTRIEGAEINQSLLALKECIRSLDQETRHTPYRQSKLTHILRDSFVGNSKTCMIANVSPSLSACENTLNTLRYADRVKELRKNTPPMSNPPSGGAISNETPTGRPFNPALFHPSNIQFSSTPKQTESEKQQKLVLTLQQDPYDTPIRGHKIRKTPEKRKVTPPQKQSKKSPTSAKSPSPMKTSPQIFFQVDRTGGMVNIRTTMGQESNSEERQSRTRSSSTGSHGSTKKASPQGPIRDSSNKASSSSALAERQWKNSSHKIPYTNNENDCSGPHSGHQSSSEKPGLRGRKSGHGTSDEGTDSDYYSPLKIPTVLDKLSDLPNTADPMKPRHLSPKPSTSTIRGNFIEEHRQILNHLDNIMDRAKVAIEESSSCENSPQKSSSYQHFKNPNNQQNLPTDSKSSSKEEEYSSRYDEIIAQQSAKYDLRINNQHNNHENHPVSAVYSASRLPVINNEIFSPLKEDVESVRDKTDLVENERPHLFQHLPERHMPDGHHFSPQRDDSDSNNDTNNQLISQVEDITSDSSNDELEETSQPSSTEGDEDDFCSCSSSQHQKLTPKQQETPHHQHQPLVVSSKSADRLESRPQQHLRRSDSWHVRQSTQILGENGEVRPLSARSNPESSALRAGDLQHVDHDISEHINNIRQLLSEDSTPGDNSLLTTGSYSVDKRVARFFIGGNEPPSSDKAVPQQQSASPEKQISQIVPKVPSSDFLQSLADIKLGQSGSRKSDSHRIEEDKQQQRLSSVNPALARLRQTFKTPDVPSLQEQRMSQSQKSMDEPTNLHSSGYDSHLQKDIDSQKRVEVSDSGISTQGRQQLEERSESDKDPEPISTASTLDGVVSLSGHPETEENDPQWESVRTHRHQLKSIIHHQASTDATHQQASTKSDSSTKELLKRHSLEELVLAGIREDRAGHPQPPLVSRSLSQIEALRHGLGSATLDSPTLSDGLTNQIPTLAGAQQQQAWASDTPEQQKLSMALGEGPQTSRAGPSIPPLALAEDEDHLVKSSSEGSGSMSARSSSSAVQRSQNLLMSAHEDQLSEITAICKQEMLLLVSVSSGEKTFEEYIAATEELLSTKAAVISTLRSQVNEFLQHPVLGSTTNTPR